MSLAGGTALTRHCARAPAPSRRRPSAAAAAARPPPQQPPPPASGARPWRPPPRRRAGVAAAAAAAASSGGGDESSGASGSGRSQADLAAEKQVLAAALQNAVQAEDYAAAARLKQELEELEMLDPITGLRLALDAAVAEERYQDAARIRDQINEIERANQPQPPDLSGVTTSSDTVTDGVRVKVRSYYVPAQSRPELGQFFFAYSVTITNEGGRAVMLNSRHWVITDGTGKVDHVRGPGVVGEQPVLEPGRSFEYQSACPLFTTVGTMEGEYEMVALDEQGEWGDRFPVKIGKFALRKPEMA